MRVNQDVLAIISECTVSDNVAFLNCGQLDRSQYVAVNKVLEAMGGKWNRKLRGHVFDDDPLPKIEQLLLTGIIMPPQNFGYFPTPPDIVARLIELADLRPAMKVLEPSAGRGNIADAVSQIVGTESIHYYELLEDNAAAMSSKGYAGSCADFLTVTPAPDFDRVVMNPPFANQQDIDHVLHASRFIKSGGLLVSVMSVGFTFRHNKKSTQFKER